MEITPSLLPAGRQIIEGYGDGGFRVGGRVYEGSILVFPGHTESWPARNMAEVTAESLRPVLEAESRVELLLLGCGVRTAMVGAALRQPLRAAGVVIEPMGSGAACRTYNMLLAEGRAVAAALIAVD